MANTTVNIAGHLVVLYDNYDGTFSFSSPGIRYEAGIGDRPAANTVECGFVWYDVTNQAQYQSDGTNWITM